jgi:uncharacterized protein YxjI
MTGTFDAGWYADPYGRHEARYYDGGQWTEHVSTGGNQRVDPPSGSVSMPTSSRDPAKIQKDVTKAGAAGWASGGGTILTEPVLVVNQKAKLYELTNEYVVYDQHGNQVGAVRQVGQSKARKALRLLTNVDQFLTHRLQLVDMAGTVLLTLTRPAKFIKSRVIVHDATGRELGALVQQNMIGKIRFAIEVADQPIGSINAENWRAWNFSIQDETGGEVARITKTWEGLAKAMFTTADNYVVQIHRPLQDPLHSLVVAAALCVDTALKQDSN